MRKAKTAGNIGLALEKKKPEERTLRAGHIAQILARDMVYLRKHYQRIKDGKVHHSKLNDEEYNRLQNLLVYFQKDDIQAHLDQYRLLELHPFLKDVKLENSKNLYEYYKKYLEKRKEYFGGDKKKEIKGVYTEIDGVWEKNKWEKERRLITAGISEQEIEEKYGYLFDFELAKVQATQLDKKYLQVPDNPNYQIPIALPSSLFKDAIIEGIEKAMQKEGKKLTFGKDEEGNEKRTVVYALREWLEKVIHRFSILTIGITKCLKKQRNI